ncbi:MAG TPA: hypothetical protein VHV55_19820 [Pirellulales bacterium]|nr:hypothetical protein [Pirellulales bacterium]
MQALLSSLDGQANALLEKLERINTALETASQRSRELPDLDHLEELIPQVAKLAGALEPAAKSSRRLQQAI